MKRVSLLATRAGRRLSRWLAVLAAAPVLAGAIARAATPALADCPMPAPYPHSVSVVDGDFKITLATDKARYEIGEGISMYLSFENTGASTLVIPNPSLITPLRSFYLLSASCGSALDPDCPLPLYYDPGVVFFYGVPIPVAPGGCESYTLKWDGLPRGGRAIVPGDYVILAGMHSGYGRIFLPPGGVRLPVSIDQQVSAERTTWGRLKALFR